MNEELAQAALRLYGLPLDARLVFLGESQNTTFQVELPQGSKFLLRLHVGIDSTNNMLTSWQAPAVIQSELVWLDALRRDTQLTVAQPVRNQADEWVTAIPDNLLHTPQYFTLLHWIEGRHLDTPPTPTQARQVGTLLAQLHQHASQWQIPAGFTRPAHDEEQLQSALPPLQTLATQGIISVADYAMFQRATEEIQVVMSNLERTSETWGIIHADLHDGNYVVYADEVRPIDFARCGFGFYLYDIGLSLGYLEPHLHADFLEGYQTLRPLPIGYHRIVEAFFISSTVENFAFLSANPHEHEGLSQAVPQVVHQHIHPYLEGKAFLFEG